VGRVATFAHEEVPPEVLTERAELGRVGVVSVAVCLAEDGTLAEAPEIAASGSLGPADADVLRDVQRAVGKALERGTSSALRRTDDDLKEAVRGAARRAVNGVLGYRPVVHVLLTRVGLGRGRRGRA
jgi:mRNA degradation ribonuclease J1/J2